MVLARSVDKESWETKQFKAAAARNKTLADGPRREGIDQGFRSVVQESLIN
jgi:hypothetical protein